MNFTNFSGQSKATPQVAAPATPGLSTKTQNWNGQQIPGDIPTKNLITYDHTTGNKTFSLPTFVGGGAYTEDKNGKLVNTGHTSYGGEAAVAGQQRDDIIPVSEGGANQNPQNIQMEPNSIAKPQDKAETAMAHEITSGQITGKQAIPLMTRQKQQISGQEPSESTRANFFSGLKSTLENFVPVGIKERAGAVQQSFQTHSLSPLKQSFANQTQDFINTHIPQTGDDKATKLAKAENLALMFSGEAGGVKEGVITPDIIPDTPEMKNAQLKLQAAQEAHGQAFQNVANAKNELDTLRQKATQAQSEVPKAQEKVNQAVQSRQEATAPAVKSVDTINERVAANKSQLGQDFQSGAAQIEKSNPNTKLNLTNKQIATLNGLKESKSFILPDKLDSTKTGTTLNGQDIDFSKLNPKSAAEIKEQLAKQESAVGQSLSPTETQDLIKQLNRSAYKEMPDGSLQADQQRIGITNEIKDVASKSFGPEWDKIYSKYSQGRAAIEKIDNLVNLDPKANPKDLNNQLESIKKLASTPEGKLRLQQSIDEYKQSNGIDLNDPVKAITQIIDKDMAIEEAQGNLTSAQKQQVESVKSQLAGAKNIEDAQQILKKAQRDAEIQQNNLKITTKAQLKQQKFENSFAGKHPRAMKWADYAARAALIGTLLRLTVYPAISKLNAKPKSTKAKTSKYGGL